MRNNDAREFSGFGFALVILGLFSLITPEFRKGLSFFGLDDFQLISISLAGAGIGVILIIIGFRLGRCAVM